MYTSLAIFFSTIKKGILALSWRQISLLSLGHRIIPVRPIMLWREPKVPDFVLEITSQSTRVQDQGTKRERYALLGVQEHFSE